MTNINSKKKKKNTFKAIKTHILLNLCKVHLYKAPYFHILYTTQPIHHLPCWSNDTFCTYCGNIIQTSYHLYAGLKITSFNYRFTVPSKRVTNVTPRAYITAISSRNTKQALDSSSSSSSSRRRNYNKHYTVHNFSIIKTRYKVHILSHKYHLSLPKVSTTDKE